MSVLEQVAHMTHHGTVESWLPGYLYSEVQTAVHVYRVVQLPPYQMVDFENSLNSCLSIILVLYKCFDPKCPMQGWLCIV